MAEVGTAFVTLLPSAKGFGRATEKQVGSEMDGAGKNVGSKFGTALKVGATAVVGGGVLLGGFLKGAIGEAREAQKVGALTNAVIKSTGGVANVTAQDVDRLSTAISLKTGIDDEQIAAGQNMLLTFSNVRNELGKGNDIFRQATVAATDMSAAFGGDAVSNSKMLGKALNDPTRGVSALTRVGVSFTQQQKDQIKTLQESGNVLGAQKIILGEVTKQTQGAAEAQATAGEKAAVAWANLQEQIGTALLPVLDRFMGVLSGQIIPAVSTFIAQIQSGAGVGGQFAAAFGTVGAVLGAAFGFIDRYRTALTALGAAIAAVVVVTQIHTAVLAVQAAGGLAAMIRGLPVVTALTRAWAAVQWVLNAALSANPIGLVVVGLVALAAGLVFAYKKSETFRNIVNAAFAAIKVVVSTVVGWFAKYVPQVFSAVASAVRTYVNVYKTVVTTAFNAIRAVVSAVMGFFGSYVRSQIAVARAAFDLVKSALSTAGKAFGEFASTVRTKVAEAVGYVRDIPGKVTAALGNLGSLLYNAGAELIQGLINGITSKLAALGSKMSEVAGKIKGFLPGSPVKTGPLTSWNNGGAGKRLMGLLADGITAGGADVEAATARVAGSAAALGGVAPLSGSVGVSSRSGRSAVGDSPLAVLHRIEAAISRQGREFGKEINGAATAGHKRRVA